MKKTVIFLTLLCTLNVGAQVVIEEPPFPPAQTEIVENLDQPLAATDAVTFRALSTTASGFVDTYLMNAQSSGRLWGGDVSAVGPVISVEAGGGWCKTNSAALSDIPASPSDGLGGGMAYVTWDALDLDAAEGYNIVFYDYSAGVMTNCLKADMGASFDFSTDFTVGRTYYDTAYGAVARLCGMNQWSKTRRIQVYHEAVHPVDLASGGSVSATGLQIGVTAASLWAEGEHNFTTAAKLPAANFVYWYKVEGVWTYIETDVINAAQYNLTAGDVDGLAALLPNKWRADYVYLVHDGSVHVVMGQAPYNSENEAQNAPRVTPPGLPAAYGTPIARITVKRDAATLTVANADNTSFSAAAIPDHNQLSGLQGGSAGEYYHLTAEQLDALGSNAATWPAAVTVAGPDWAIDYTNLMQRVDLTGTITNITFQTLPDTETRFVEMWISGATNVTYAPTGLWVREPTWTNENAHVVFSWSLGTVSGSVDKETP